MAPQSPLLMTYKKRRRRRLSGAWVVSITAMAVMMAGGLWLYARQPTSGLLEVGRVVLPTASVDMSDAAPRVAQSDTRSSATKAGIATENAPSLISVSEPARPRGSGNPPDAPVEPRKDFPSESAVRFPDAPSVEPRSFGRLSPEGKYVALTLDDGYGFRPEMLELLQQYDARCTTFLVGEWVKNNPGSVRMMRDAGFEIANHTWDHKLLTKLSDYQIERQLGRTQTAISSLTGDQAPYMRPPGGATNDRVRHAAGRLGYNVVLWNRTLADSSSEASARKSYRSVMKRNGGVQPGDIILCHWGSEAAYEALQRILPELKAQGYEFVTVSELVARSSGE